MHRVISAVAALAFVTTQAQAQVRCASAADETVFELQALKSELVVLAIGCKLDERYNAFVTRYRPTLGKNESDFTAYFKRTHGSRGQQEQDDYITQLANAHSQEGIHQGTVFCARNTQMFDEVMALHDASELSAYAAGKDVVPASIGACVVQPPTAPTRNTAANRASTGRRAH